MMYLCLVKKVFATFFLVLILGATMHQLALTAMYVLNQDYIAATFCVNKDKVEMKCNGKCHLSKNIAKTQEKTEQRKATLDIQLLLPVFLSESIIELPSPITNRLAYISEVLPLKDTYLFSSLDPPRQLL